MLIKKVIISSFTSLGLLFGLLTNQVAQMPHTTHKYKSSPTSELQRIEQPLWLKGVVTVSGLGLIGLEIWWFLLSRPKSKNAESQLHKENRK